MNHGHPRLREEFLPLPERYSFLARVDEERRRPEKEEKRLVLPTLFVSGESKI